MDFAPSEEQQAIFDMACAFAAEPIVAHVQAWEQAGTIPRDLWIKAAELGFGGLFVSNQHDGTGSTRLDGTLVFKALQSSRIFPRQAARQLDRDDRTCEVPTQRGDLADCGIEKIGRDLPVHQILEGTNEITRLIVSCAILTERG